ncbi:LacI family transcriptional regulator [Streptomyces sp. A7024]|uniref:LacI family transcriptional regulator n=1 Tax=Streptomyces coryli TaxID=1128680 RepID=A0A6G4TSB4_9ACTN|nr:LacI family DNA-binding transcriptional regulator [Streptomyces coryli]NGN62744.1 LacI family transcriptional regulator [Streptomyces coryli]
MSATIKDVAKLAGVSMKTVSNVLNGYPHLTPETRGKVERALAELNYRPNIAARNLRSGRTGLIALAVPTTMNPYFAEIAHLIVREAQDRGLTVLIDCTEGDLEREKHVAEGFRSQLLDGMILQPWSLSATYLRNRADRTPLVLLGERKVQSADSVAIDSKAAVAAAIEHLVGLGRRRIGAIGPPLTKRTGAPPEPRRRHAGYLAALTAAGIEPDPALVAHHQPNAPHDVTEAVVDHLLAQPDPPDAIFCFNDRTALATLRELRTRGVRVPDDIAVIGVDDVEGARLSTPSLSSIAPDKQGIARTAVNMLTERIEGANRPARQVVAGFEVMARESTVGTDAMERAGGG